MKKSLFRTVLILIASLTLSPSLSRADAELEQQLKQVIQEDTNLSPDQRTKLTSIIQDVTQKNNALQEQIRTQKVEFLKALLANPQGSKEARNLKRSLIKLHDQRLENSLKALEELKEVLGHQKNPQILFQKILDVGGRF
ncbi:hypothetical protein EBZ37_12035 [bacterium]|nr:hypothetical protein [bacterium]